MIPASVQAIAAGQPFAPVWRNELGGLTFALDGAPRRFVKWMPAAHAGLLAREQVRLTWAARFTPVPVVLDHGSDAEGGWLVTAALPGDNAVSPRWLAAPRQAVAAIGAGLRALHDALPVRACPFSWSLDERLADVRRRAPDAPADWPSRWHAVHHSLSVARALAILDAPPPIDRLVVCHGDSCAPNTLLDDQGRWLAHVDLGGLGVADRWADLAVATWSTQWNYGPGWEASLLEAYGIAPDEERTRYYRLLWDLAP